MNIPNRVARRITDRCEPGPGGCLISTYSVGSHGYAQIGWHENGTRVMTLVHRALWIHVNGAIPDGVTVDHVCKNRRCINIDHLRLLPNFENARRTAGRDWTLGECINGHPNSELRTTSSGAYCRICRGEWSRRYYEANREKYADWQRARRALKSTP